MQGRRTMYRSITHALHRFIRRGPDGTAGVSAIEFAIIAPILIFMAFCMLDFAMGFYRKTQVESAAQAGAQYAILHGFDANSIASAVLSATSVSGITASPTPNQFCGCPTSTGITSATCNTTCATGSVAGTYVAVSAQANYATLFSYPGIPNSFNFTSTSTARLQ